MGTSPVEVAAGGHGRATPVSAGLREWPRLISQEPSLTEPAPWAAQRLWKDMCCQLWGLDMASQPRTCAWGGRCAAGLMGWALAGAWVLGIGGPVGCLGALHALCLRTVEPGPGAFLCLFSDAGGPHF